MREIKIGDNFLKQIDEYITRDEKITNVYNDVAHHDTLDRTDIIDALRPTASEVTDIVALLDSIVNNNTPEQDKYIKNVVKKKLYEKRVYTQDKMMRCIKKAYQYGSIEQLKNMFPNTVVDDSVYNDTIHHMSIVHMRFREVKVPNNVFRNTPLELGKR